MGARLQRVEVVEGAEQRVDVAVVGDVVAGVLLRRREEGREPDRVDAEVGERVEAGGDAGQVADAVAVGVRERARVDLVDDGGAPPLAALTSPALRSSARSTPLFRGDGIPCASVCRVALTSPVNTAALLSIDDLACAPPRRLAALRLESGARARRARARCACASRTSSAPVTAVRTRSNPDHEPRFAVASLDRARSTAGTGGRPRSRSRTRCTATASSSRWATAAACWLNADRATRPPRRSTTRTSSSSPTRRRPAWARRTVMYQIFPDRFARSAAADCPRAARLGRARRRGRDEPIHIGPSTARQFYGGDLAGIEEHLDHLVRPRRHHGLPHPDLSGAVEPPLRRALVRRGRSAARRRRGARLARRGRPRARAHRDRRPHLQPLGRCARVVHRRRT